MPTIDSRTLLVSLQATYECINRYEALLDSETLKDPETIDEILMLYYEGFNVLKAVYQQQLDKGETLPSLQQIIPAKL